MAAESKLNYISSKPRRHYSQSVVETRCEEAVVFFLSRLWSALIVFPVAGTVAVAPALVAIMRVSGTVPIIVSTPLIISIPVIGAVPIIVGAPLLILIPVPALVLPVAGPVLPPAIGPLVVMFFPLTIIYPAWPSTTFAMVVVIVVLVPPALLSGGRSCSRPIV